MLMGLGLEGAVMRPILNHCRQRPEKGGNCRLHSPKHDNPARLDGGAPWGISQRFLPHLVPEFVTALIEDCDPFPNAVQAANITCAGILAHESALKNGACLRLPDFTLRL